MGHLTTKEALAIANAIQSFLHSTGQSRKSLIGRPPHKLSESTVNKVFQGAFSERTLIMIEATLGRSFRVESEPAKEDARADKEAGGYTFETAQSLQGDYLCARPLFANPTNLNAYLVSIHWHQQRKRLAFEEKFRADAKHAQKGWVYLPFGLPFMNLVSGDLGGLRTIILSLPLDGLCRGIISTLSNPRGALYIPVSAPIFLQRLSMGAEPPQLGIITADNPVYSQYHKTLATVTAEEFGIFVLNRNLTERRRGISIVNNI
jgi:hypothetical protein